MLSCIVNSDKIFLSQVEKTNIPFVSSYPAKRIVPDNKKHFCGIIGRHGNERANKVINNSDLVISLGFGWGAKAISENFNSDNTKKIISVDIDKNEMSHSIIKPDLAICSDINIFLNKIKNKIKLKNYSGWNNYCNHLKKNFYVNNLNHDFREKVNPYKFFRILSEISKKNETYVLDTGANICWFMMAFEPKKSQNILSAWNHSPMGCSIATACGYSKSNNQNIFSIIGDGGLMMNPQELQFLKHNKTNIKTIVMDNQCLGNTKLGTKYTFNNRTFANDAKNGYYPCNVKKITNSFDFKYIKIENNSEIKGKLKKFKSSIKNVILHVVVSQEHDVIDHTIKKINSAYKFDK